MPPIENDREKSSYYIALHKRAVDTTTHYSVQGVQRRGIYLTGDLKVVEDRCDW